MAEASTAVAADYDVTDIKLAAQGDQRVAWAARDMPVLAQIRDRFASELPFQGLRVGGCLHITAETANLALALAAGGARVALCASNPLSTQDSVAASLAGQGISVFARRGEDHDVYYAHLESVLATKPQITMDDGADLVSLLHQRDQAQSEHVVGSTEETTTGVIRLRAMAKAGVLRFPVIAVNEALTKHLFDNRYGTGQSTIDGLIRATNVLLAGRTFVVCGFGWCGRGLAARARGMGAQVIVTEVDPTRALEAVMEGFQVMTLLEAAPRADVVITVTGDCNVVDRRHFEVLKDGCLVANSGHFNSEINLAALDELTTRVSEARPLVSEHTLISGRRLYLLAEGRLLNLAAAEGHPASVMDMSFANQALSAAYLARHAGELEAAVHDVPKEIDEEVARLKLAALGVDIDVLTAEQVAYLGSWEQGTD
ncbi:MAG TPA: adenosylhomocysteinase [Candidatus Saccharimonadales bacterium]|nr:adenosylhomocysteinase [Candidatus Saccharimonadales bacterium]